MASIGVGHASSNRDRMQTSAVRTGHVEAGPCGAARFFDHQASEMAKRHAKRRAVDRGLKGVVLSAHPAVVDAEGFLGTVALIDLPDAFSDMTDHFQVILDPPPSMF